MESSHSKERINIQKICI